MVQLSQPYLTPGKTIALSLQTFVSKMMSLLFSMLSGFVIAWVIICCIPFYCLSFPFSISLPPPIFFLSCSLLNPKCLKYCHIIDSLDNFTGEGDGTPVQYSCLENPTDGGAWWAVVHGVGKSQTRLSDFPFTFHFHAWEKEMATHSSVLAWRIPGTGEPGGLPSMGSQRVGHD